MQVKITYLSECGYAGISEGNREMNIRLELFRTPEKSLRETAQEMRVKADLMIDRADLIERAADQLEAERAK